MVNSKDVDRLFLQAVISRRCFSQKMGKLLWKKCIEAVKAVDENLDIEYDDSKDAWANYITKLNDSMNALNLEIVPLHDETTGVPMFALVNRKGDELAQVASDYSPQELAYFKAIVDLIMTAPYNSFCVSSLGALREISNLKINMTKAQGEVVLSSFVARGWLEKSSKGKYTLSTRTSLELFTYLKNTYAEEILECTICLEIVTRGVRCHTPNCRATLHQHCHRNYTKNKNKCPTCDQLWDDEDKKVKPVGEAAYREGQDQNRTRTRKADESDEEEEEEEFESDSQPVPTQTQTQTQVKSKGKGKGKKVAKREDIMEEEEEEEDSPPPRTQPKRRSRR